MGGKWVSIITVDTRRGERNWRAKTAKSFSLMDSVESRESHMTVVSGLWWSSFYFATSSLAPSEVMLPLAGPARRGRTWHVSPCSPHHHSLRPRLNEQGPEKNLLMIEQSKQVIGIGRGTVIW